MLNNYHKSLTYLIQKGTRDIQRGPTTFFDYSLNLYNLLKTTGHDEDTCFTGLFFNIYKDPFLKIELEKDRKKIKEIIGEKAEKLIWEKENHLKDPKIKNLLTFITLTENVLFKIYDNVFDEPTIDKLYGYYRDRKAWTFTGAGSEASSSKWRKFNYVLDHKDKIDKILYKAADKIISENNLTPLVKRVREYASGNIYGTVHELHRDDGAQNYNEIFTVMFYLNKIWQMHYAGETIFLTQDWNDIWKSAIPKPGRAVLFDGFLPHGAREVSRDCVELRMVATIKYKIKYV